MSDSPTVPDADLVDDGRSVYRLEYHLLLATRRQRPFFDDVDFRARAGEMVVETCHAAGCEVLSAEFGSRTLRLHVSAPPTLSPHALVVRLRAMAGAMRAEFPALKANGGLFVRRYIATSVPASATACERFVRAVPTR